MALTPIPPVSGTVRDRESGDPVAGAMVIPEGSMTGATTDASGRFSLDRPDEKSEFLTIRARGYSDCEVPLRRHGETTLPPILLGHGSTLTVVFERECGSCDTTATLFRRHEGDQPASHRWRQIASRTVSEAKARWNFENLEEGNYALLFAGRGALERKLLTFPLPPGEKVEKSVSIHDLDLKGSVTLGSTSFPHASLELSTNRALWKGSVQTDDRGDYAATIWDGGTWTVSVTVPGEREAYLSARSLATTPAQFWDVVIPKREIAGRVIDTETGEGIAGVTVYDDALTPPAQRAYYPVESDANGAFRFGMVAAGRHRIYVEAEGYLSPAPRLFEMIGEESRHELTIELSHGQRVWLQVLDETGLPLPNARIYDWVGPEGIEDRGPIFTDAAGKAFVALAKGERKAVYVVADSGAFRIEAASSDSDSTEEKPLVVMLPSLQAALTLSATTRDGDPLPQTQFLIRYNGRTLPPRILDLVAELEGVTATTGPTGPVTLPRLPLGTYEIWPYQTFDQLRRLLSSLATSAGTKVTLQAGENRVVVVE
jgi:hypothetical protein